MAYEAEESRDVVYPMIKLLDFVVVGLMRDDTYFAVLAG